MNFVTQVELLHQLDQLESKCRQEMYDALERQEQMFVHREEQLIQQIRLLQEQVNWLQVQQQSSEEERAHKVRKISSGSITHMCYLFEDTMRWLTIVLTPKIVATSCTSL